MISNFSVLSNAAAQFAGKALTIITSLIIVKLLTGIGPGFYGDYVTSYEFLAFFGILADAGLFAIAVKEIAQSDSKSSSSSGKGRKSEGSPDFILGNILAMRLVLVMLFSTLAGVIAGFIPSYSETVRLGIWITAISMGLTIIAGTLSSVLQARMRIAYFSLSLVLGKILLAGFVFVLARDIFTGLADPTDLHPYLWAGVISNILFVLLVALFVRREVTITLRFDLCYWNQTLRTSLPYGLALVLQTLYLRLDILLISVLLGATATGIYGVSGRIMESFLILGVFFGQAFLPRIASFMDQKQADQALQWAVEKLVFIALPIVWGTVLFAPQLILILSNEAFLTTPQQIGSDRLLQILVPTVFFAFLNQLFTFTLVHKNRQIYLMFINGGALILNGFLNYFFLVQHGLMVAALSTVLCEVIVLGFLWREIRRHFTLCWSQFLSLVTILNLGLFALLYWSPLIDHLWLSLGISGLVYGGFAWWQRTRFV